MPKIFVTRKIPASGLELLQAKGYEVTVSTKDGVLTKDELTTELKSQPYDGVLSLLTDKIDAEVLSVAPTVKIFANYAVGYDNVDLAAAKEKGIIITNTPGVLTNSVAEHAFALLISVAKRIAEADQFTRTGKYIGWAPELLLGVDLTGKTIGIAGLGRIGTQVAHHAAKGFAMKVAYYDVKRNAEFEKEYQAEFKASVEELLPICDFVSIHVPLLDTTRHFINAERLGLMKKTAILVNTSRGPVVDEVALVEALKNGTIRGAGLDVFENEPKLAPGLAALPNVILTPHTASATEETRSAMSTLAAQNLIDFFDGKEPRNLVK